MFQNNFFLNSLVSLMILLGSSLASSQSQSLPQKLTEKEATQLVIESLKNTEILSSKSYCTKGTMTCRTMYRLRDKRTGKPSPVYYDTFYSADRQVGSTCYFIPSKSDPAQYYVLTDSVFDGKLWINIISPQFGSIHASADYSNIIFANLKSPKIGTTQYSLGFFYQTNRLVIFKGTTYDSADPNFKQNVYIEYWRIQP